MDRQEGLPRNQKGRRRRGKRKEESAAFGSPSQKITHPKEALLPNSPSPITTTDGGAQPGKTPMQRKIPT
jgi:hypothetical protein